MRSNFPDPYRLSDLTIERLSKIILKRVEQLKSRLTVLKFDELSSLKEIDVFYEKINNDCISLYRELYLDRFEELWLFLNGKKPNEDELEEIADIYFSWFLDEPHKVTHYAFSAELIRKRDRAKEAFLSVPTKAQKQLELDKAGRFVIQQTAWYSDFVSQDAEIQAYRDAGIKKVKWNTYGDDRVCDECKKLNGNVFDIESVPDRPHLRCRCYLTAV